MEGVEKRGLFVFGILALFIIMFTGFSEAAITCSSSDQIILRLSDVTNAHGEVWNGAGNYTEEICYDTIFGVAGSGDRSCGAANEYKVVGLSGSTNAHAEEPSLSNYATDVCYGGLSCTARVSGCFEGEFSVVGLSTTSPIITNAHLSNDGSYPVNICCSIGPLPPSEDCTITSASWSVTEAVEDDLVDLDIVTSDCADDTIISFEVWENDLLGDDPVSTNPLNRSIDGNSATGTWKAEWQEDGIGDPEYYFIVTIVASGKNMQSSNQLTVTPKPITPYCNTVIICGDYYDATSGNPTAENACNIDATLCDVAEFSVETKEDDDGFCDAGDINCLCEWNTLDSVCNSVWEVIEDPVHAICVGNSCMLGDGAGTDECSVSSPDCDGESPAHAECVDEMCVEVAGEGVDECAVIGASCGPICGNGEIDSGEQCDGTNFGIITSCSVFSLTDGALDCYSPGHRDENGDLDECQFDTNGCVGVGGICGDNTINPGETCDGGNWGLILSCTDFDNYDYGNLDCGGDCQFDTQCFRDSDSPTVVGKCVYTSATTGSCETDSFLTSSWTATWIGDASSRSTSCVDGQDVIECPAQIQLAFFNLYNMLITLLAIAGIYGIISLRKKH